VFRYVNPRSAAWPQAEFIVGNPPFIGKGEDMRTELEDGYVRALWASRGKKSDSIDFVMYWWDQAATILRAKGSRLRRFGFITTNSITQKFSRRVLEKHLKAPKDPASLVFAVPDHPWVKQGKGLSKKAAVRIAMTVVENGERLGKLANVTKEANLDTDQPVVELEVHEGKLSADLTIGADVTGTIELRANDGVANNGVLLAGKAFVLDPRTAEQFRRPGVYERIIRPYVDGRELAHRPASRFVIDAFGLRAGPDES